jgi:hypothetical protein
LSEDIGSREKLIIDITEEEHSVLTDKNDIDQIKVDGKISVINPSNECRIWNAELTVKNIDNTNLGEGVIKVGEVQTKGKWKQGYNVTTDQPLLRLVEIVDTCAALKSLEPHWAFSHNVTTDLTFTIRITNVSDSKISNVIVRKTYPTAFGKPDIEPTEVGKAIFHPKNREITWEDIELLPNTDAEIRIKAEVKPTSPQPYDAGQIMVTYEVPEKNRSSIDVSINSLTNAMVGGSQEEDPRQPGKWICVADLLNDSTFPLMIAKTEAMHHLPSGETVTVVDEEPKVVIAPKETYEKEFIIESPQPPEVERKITYSVINEVRRKVIGSIMKKPNILPVIALEGIKQYNPGEVDAYDKTPMMSILRANNVGSSPLNEVTFVEILPADFKPPNAGDVVVKVNGQPLTEGVAVKCEPDDDDPAKEHRMTLAITDMDQNIGSLHPNGQIVVEYPVVAWSPKPQQEYFSPMTVTGNVQPPVYPSKTTIQPVKIDVRYVSRKVAIYKTVQPGSTQGEYVIPLKFINRGGVAVEHITIQDFVPEGFTMLSVDPPDLRPEEVPTEGGVNLIWSFPRIEKGNQVSIKYTIKGEGEYTRREPKQIVK